MNNQAVTCKISSNFADGALATHRAIPASKIYFFLNGTATLRRGRISVTPNVCDEEVGISPANDSPDLNRRLRCPRASKHSQPLASLQSSQHAAASKKKKLLLLSQLSKRLLTTSTNTTFAGRSFCIAPQNPNGQTSLSAPSFSDIDTFAPSRARAGRSHVRMTARRLQGRDHDFRLKVTSC